MIRKLLGIIGIFVGTLLLIFLLSSCMPMSRVPVNKPLPPVVIRIPDGEVYLKCFKTIPLWQHIVFFPALVLGCAELLPEHGACIVWVGESSTEGVIEHEKQHCLGYVH